MKSLIKAYKFYILFLVFSFFLYVIFLRISYSQTQESIKLDITSNIQKIEKIDYKIIKDGEMIVSVISPEGDPVEKLTKENFNIFNTDYHYDFKTFKTL